MSVPEQSIYSRTGGETSLREFVEHFYGFMEIFPEISHVCIAKTGIERNQGESV